MPRFTIELDFKGKNKEMRGLKKGLTIGTLAGGFIGIVSGILTAPKSGKETRKELKESVKDVSQKAALKVKETAQTVKHKFKDNPKEIVIYQDSSQNSQQNLDE
ncbi:YtxH-like protein [Caloramator fervidus]|uniref:YtxH-like protein n=1 Tax=Caloramator fervidus TaxID=29344 RepID=A0A1H5VJU3_9CLOT|nr:YtxH domain-containing protein [Caloramator fervidus]SEF87463.1 YtxH-like protein [Caloramator fervidus]